MEVEIYEDKDLYRRATELFVNTANESISENGFFRVALSGGSTPGTLYSLLGENHADVIRWDSTHIFFGDERCVPPDHPGSNFRMANRLFLSKINIPPENVHRIKGEIDPRTAAAEYTRDLRQTFGIGPEEAPQFDLILLGIGEEGHTASIFPGTDSVGEFSPSKPVVSVYVRQLDSYRITLTPPVLMHSRNVMFLAVGSAKAEAVHQALEGPYTPNRYPAQLLRKAEGMVIWLIDPDSASLLTTYDHRPRTYGVPQTFR
jgi:6-phosphogluconolactonase